VEETVVSIADLPADDRVPPLSMTIGERLRENARRFGDRPALQWESAPGSGTLVTLTYADLLRVAESAAASLRAHVAPGDRVSVWAANSPEWVVLECACALSGTVLTALNTAWADDEVRHALRLTTPRVLYVGADTRGLPLEDRAADLAGEVATTLDHPIAVLPLATLPTDPAAVTPVAPADPGITPADPFLIQFTSGTTGHAKGATLSHRAVLNSGRLRAASFGADEHDVWVNPVPLHHMGGSCVVVMAALSSGGSYVVMPRFDPELMVRMMRVAGATRIGGVPTMLYALLDVPGAEDAVTTVTAIGLGGTSVPPSLVERIQQDFGSMVAVVYAQSECPMITSTTPDTDAVSIATTVGVPSANTAIRIVGDDGTPLPRGGIGELCVRSPLTMIGYWDDPVATAAAFDADGYLRTGDLGSIDDDGVVRIHGRAREMIIRGGENIYPIEVEDVLLRHPAVAAAAVIAVPSERWGEEVGAVIQADRSVSGDDLEAYVAASVAHFKVPRHWRFVEGFPMTAAGKIRKVELPALFTGGSV
jgi:fatty-acyl-CoA synthase